MVARVDDPQVEKNEGLAVDSNQATRENILKAKLRCSSRLRL